MFRKYITPGFVERVADGSIIPEDPKNADYQAVQAWLADGNQFEPSEQSPEGAA